MVNGSYSTISLEVSGAWQGSVQEPILFSIFINDLEYVTKYILTNWHQTGRISQWVLKAVSIEGQELCEIYKDKWSLCPWRFSRPGWRKSWATWSDLIADPALSIRLDRYLLRSHSICLFDYHYFMILWSCKEQSEADCSWRKRYCLKCEAAPIKMGWNRPWFKKNSMCDLIHAI